MVGPAVSPPLIAHNIRARMDRHLPDIFNAKNPAVSEVRTGGRNTE